MSLYAGIGARRVPPDIEGLCVQIAQHLRKEGWTLRSGHAIGCDQAFERGAREDAEIFLPWKDYEWEAPRWGELGRSLPSVAAIKLTGELHPTGGLHVSMASMRLLARNAHIILGVNLDSPVDGVICYSPNEKKGGTAQALRVARAHGIPVENLADQSTRAKYERVLR